MWWKKVLEIGCYATQKRPSPAHWWRPARCCQPAAIENHSPKSRHFFSARHETLSVLKQAQAQHLLLISEQQKN
jgi:hypothetical protein